MTTGARCALITGASSGIGAAIAHELAREGWRLILVGRNAERLSKEADACRAAGAVEASAFVGDVCDGEAMAHLFAAHPALDLFVANAGILDGRRDGGVLESGAVARRVLETNLLAAVDGLHAALPSVRAAKGRLLIVSSLAAYAPLTDAPAYSASKAGLLAYGLAMHEALRGEGIGVTVACPGYVYTPMATIHDGARPGEISASDAARRILRASFRGEATVGFPFGLHQSARISGLLPRWLTRRFTRHLRFRVADA